jgi:hypothetical protein
VEKHDVRHDRGTQNADREQHALGPLELRHERVPCHLAPVGCVQDGFDHVAGRDHADQRREDSLQRAEAIAL